MAEWCRKTARAPGQGHRPDLGPLVGYSSHLKADEEQLIDLSMSRSGAPPAIMTHAPATAAPAFQEIPQTAFYDHHYDRGMVPNTAPISSDVAGRVNYVVPSPAETAAIAAQSRFKRPRGNTVPR